MKKRQKSAYHTRAKYDALNPVFLSPDLINMYARMRKSEIILHLIIQSRADDGRLKRNIRAVEWATGIHHEGLVEAESSLKRMKLLRISRQGNLRIWTLPEFISETECDILEPELEEMVIGEQDVDSVVDSDEDDKEEKKSGFIRWLRGLIE
jgi:hypothetical protein